MNGPTAMILEDKLLTLRLQREPEFLLRMHEVLARWKRGSKPALFVQARPAPGNAVHIDTASDEVTQILRRGSGGHERWWDSFVSAASPQTTLHGIAGLADWREPGWTFEVHRDGHLLAGVWTFPSLPARDGEQLVIPDFFAGFFVEFFKLVSDMASALQIRGEYQVTATLLHASQLRFAAVSQGARPIFAGQSSELDHLQWAIEQASLNTDGWEKLGLAMATGIAGGYGYRPR